jgi:pimeloyl-ACP methyl ester carboxylesterase
MQAMSGEPEAYKTNEAIAAAVTCPSLMIWGERGKKTRTREIEDSQRLMKGSKLVMVKSCGHYVQDEKPEQAAQAILAFLQKP